MNRKGVASKFQGLTDTQGGGGWGSDQYSQSGSPAPGRIAAPSPSASARDGAAGKDPGLGTERGEQTQGGAGTEETRWRQRWQLWPPGRGPRSSLGPARAAAVRGAGTRCHGSQEGRGRNRRSGDEPKPPREGERLGAGLRERPVGRGRNRRRGSQRGGGGGGSCSVTSNWAQSWTKDRIAGCIMGQCTDQGVGPKLRSSQVAFLRREGLS